MTWYLAVLNDYAGFRGRARRREYWMFILVNAIIGIALVAIGKLTKMPDGPTLGIGMSRNGLGVFGIGVFSNPFRVWLFWREPAGGVRRRPGRGVTLNHVVVTTTSSGARRCDNDVVGWIAEGGSGGDGEASGAGVA